MMKKLSILLLAIIAISCATKKRSNGCFFPAELSEKGQNSKIIEFKRIALMDTVTAVILGKIFYLKDSIPTTETEITLSSRRNKYKTSPDSLGQFKFSHIKSGDYTLRVWSRLCRELNVDTIKVLDGEVKKLVIGMGEMGQDDFSK